MNKLLCTLAATTILTASIASPASAGPKNTGSSKTIPATPVAKVISLGTIQASKFVTPTKTTLIVKQANYHLTQGTKFDQGYFYKGKNHFHWAIVQFDGRYGCDCYWDPYVRGWYYWCEPALCYYPVSYCPYQVYNWSAPMTTPGQETPEVPVVPIDGVVETPIDAVPPIPAPVALNKRQ